MREKEIARHLLDPRMGQECSNGVGKKRQAQDQEQPLCLRIRAENCQPPHDDRRYRDGDVDGDTEDLHCRSNAGELADREPGIRDERSSIARVVLRIENCSRISAPRPSPV